MGRRQRTLGHIVSAAVGVAISAYIIGFIVYGLTGPPSHGIIALFAFAFLVLVLLPVSSVLSLRDLNKMPPADEKPPPSPGDNSGDPNPESQRSMSWPLRRP